MDVLFKALDQASASPHTILGSSAARERYESIVMFAFRKLQAGRYHRDNVERLLASEQAAFEEAVERHGPEPAAEKGGIMSRRTTSVRLQRSADAFAFELSAFLAAIKTGLDFLATVGAMHLPGITADSIATLMKQANKGGGGPILAEVSAAMPWLTSVRDYRHHLLHRLVLLPTAGWAVTSRDGAVAAAAILVIVPEKTPAYVPDTRRARMMEDEVPFGVMERRSFGSVTYADGTSEVISWPSSRRRGTFRSPPSWRAIWLSSRLSSWRLSTA